ncbi:DNA repair protein RecO [Jeongeupia naejangsanensis]|uniref:DNA repair protein RecO n=1 Tax=Jeongeupia naejangsanensis TaxID=613195 RepID=A0ABS2BJ98_9NEIS|nr:DNA repair protein RecO [Jeongeupia naejangsanensis]MBM3115520.1 DNA repair protein RecO [Jeongeupia naejangsanensis]
MADKPARKPRRKPAGEVPRIDAQPAFILHQYAYRETSRLLDVFSRDHGRVMIVARGVQRPGSQLRGSLLAFQPILLAWFGAGEVKTLHAAEWQGGLPQLSGLPLLCGFYLNELLMKLMPREDAHPALFGAYFDAIRQLGHAGNDKAAVEPVLRTFELSLLRVLGYAPALGCLADSTPLQPTWRYGFEPSLGVVPARDGATQFDAAALLAIEAGNFADERVLAQAKLLMRLAFAPLLADAPLHTRQLLIDLQTL